MRVILFAVVLAPLLVACDDGDGDGNRGGGPLQPQTGSGETVFTTGEDPNNPYFKDLGSNQRVCSTCHDVAAGWSVTPTGLRDRFEATDGMDPIFRPVDGANSPTADVSTLDARLAAYSMMLKKAVIRVGQPMPENAEFTLTSVNDRYGFASAAELSLFRRPLPSTNLRFMAELMWDSREPTLDMQAMDATLGHAQAMAINTTAIAQIVAFESSLYTAQRIDEVAGDLSEGAKGGAAALVDQPFAIGINDPANGFNRDAMTLFASWANASTSTPQGQRRASIARGEQLFNTHPLRIRGVAGLADQQGTCSTCHDTPNVGNHSKALAMDIGVSRADERYTGLPLYTLHNKTTGQTVQSTDPGVALVTGKWADIGKFKVPSLRGVVMRPPYFHNGLANNLDEVLDFYNRRFDTELSRRDTQDLINFLSAL